MHAHLGAERTHLGCCYGLAQSSAARKHSLGRSAGRTFCSIWALLLHVILRAFMLLKHIEGELSPLLTKV